jgi:hypothetical protein
MKQGKIWAGAITTQVWADVDIVHQGRHIVVKDLQLYVWDMDRDVTLSCAFLDHHKLQDWKEGEQDDKQLRRLSTVSSGWEPAASDINKTTAYHIEGDRGPEGPDMSPSHNVRFQGMVASSATTEIPGAHRNSLATTTNRHDSWTREKAEALREKLVKQLREPIPALQAALERVADEYKEAFGDDISQPCDFKPFKIRLKAGAQFIAMVPRRLSEPMLEEVQRQMAALLEQGVIKPSDSPWAFPLVLARRPGSDKVRCCVDYRLLNLMVEPYPYGMADLHQTLDGLVGHKFYWSVDVSSYYHQISVEADSMQYTAFVLPGGSKFEYSRVPFGIKTAPAWAQQQLRETLQGNKGTEKLVNFLDDVTFGANTIEESVDAFRELLKFCIAHRLKLRRSKCTLGVSAVKALGFVVNEQGKWIDPARVLSLLKIPQARTPKELKQLLGSFGFVRQFLCDSAKVCAPLFDLLKKGVKFRWTAACDQALERLKQSVVLSPCLGQIDSKKTVYARVDASDVGVACVLYQMVVVDGKELPQAIAYASRRFSPTEMRWPLCDREGYASKFVFERFHQIMAGLSIVIETDHKNHLFMHNAVSMKVQRWRLYMQQFNYEIRHLAGIKNEIADGMSRVFEDISSLHISNLMQTAPTCEQARLERQQGIISPSTFLLGTTDPDPLSCIQCGTDEDDEGPGGPDGEGGADEALFNMVTARMCESSTGTYTLPDMEEPVRFGAHEAKSDEEFDKEVGILAEGATFEAVEESEEPNGEGATEAPEGGDEDEDEDASLREQYTRGFELLLKMGWTRGSPIGKTQATVNPVLDGSEVGWGSGDFRGVGVPGTRSQKNRESAKSLLERKWRQVHNATAGHMGEARTYRRLRQLPGFPWDLRTSEIQDLNKGFCKNCLLCNKVWKLRGDPQRAQGAVIRQRPFTEVAMDLIVLTEPDVDGNKNILVLIDSFSRAVELFPVKTGDAVTVASCLYDVYNRYGQPMRLRCDGAKAFLGSICRYFNRMMKVKLHCVEPYSPQQNGQCERVNQEIMRHLRAMIISDESGANSHFRWGLLASAARRIVNNSINWETGVTPNELLYGGYADTDLCLMGDHPALQQGQSTPGWRFAKELEDCQAELLRRSELHQEELLEKVRTKAEASGVRQLEGGVWVLAKRGGLGKRPKTKLQSRYMGPYLVVNRTDPTNSLVHCQHLATKKIVKFHMSELVVVDLSDYRDVNDAIPISLKDNWTYMVESIVEHKPVGPRRTRGGGLRKKSMYSFKVKYALLPESVEIGEENPCWQPWDNCEHLEALKDYCQKPDVCRDLGRDFYVSEEEE